MRIVVSAVALALMSASLPGCSSSTPPPSGERVTPMNSGADQQPAGKKGGRIPAPPK